MITFAKEASRKATSAIILMVAGALVAAPMTRASSFEVQGRPRAQQGLSQEDRDECDVICRHAYLDRGLSNDRWIANCVAVCLSVNDPDRSRELQASTGRVVASSLRTDTPHRTDLLKPFRYGAGSITPWRLP
ncbi:hypothetical protein [Lichenifustis flavocetrariae]|uniref:Uncharacterized protein n=1 Tax=Lichenifustis flavocetrariae TaxID=2949735 RepID=A0AA41ZB54_9HYPH|nr:hypothetical protein [Lichenifustis flavocetrariae]MCW6512657.1 hypothetical protein [Lichenifustis flavocetrariae]